MRQNRDSTIPESGGSPRQIPTARCLSSSCLQGDTKGRRDPDVSAERPPGGVRS